MRPAADRRRPDRRLPRCRRLAAVRQPAADRPIDAAPSLAGCGVGDGPIPTLAEPARAGRRPGAAAARGQGRRRYLALGAGARSGRFDGYDGPFGVMSFDPRLPRLLKTNLPSVRRGLVVRGQPAAAGSAGWRCGWPHPHFLAVGSRRARQALGRAARARRMPVYSWTVRTAEQRAQAAVHADALIWEADGRP